MTSTRLLQILAVSTIAISGCIRHNSTVTRDVTRRKVEFENESAGRVFYDALSQIPNSGTKQEKTSQFEIPVVLDYKRHVITGPNAAFNDAVDRCDTNKDAKISEIEAKIFAEQVRTGRR
ncbi:MAG: hypothetical protein JWO95_1353 [Verrucomicrobiales bacterium]|nr:hypothetical protein [Verrucomicrobiales bacterium]